MNNPCAKWISLGCLLLVACTAGCPTAEQPGPTETDQTQSQSAREKGTQQAQAAIAAGELKLKEYPPLPHPPGHGQYTALLREKCGVAYEVISTSGPGYSQALKQEVAAWNQTMEAEIKRQFGPDILQRLQDEAQKTWQQSQSPKKQEPPDQPVAPITNGATVSE